MYILCKERCMQISSSEHPPRGQMSLQVALWWTRRPHVMTGSIGWSQAWNCCHRSIATNLEKEQIQIARSLINGDSFSGTHFLNKTLHCVQLDNYPFPFETLSQWMKRFTESINNENVITVMDSWSKCVKVYHIANLKVVTYPCNNIFMTNY